MGGTLYISFLVAYFIFPQVGFDGFTLMGNVSETLLLHETV